MQRLSKATASKKSSGKKKRGAVHSMSINKAENGFTSDIAYEPSPDAKDEEKYGPHLNETNVHPNVKHLLKHVSNTFAPAAPAAADGTPAHEAAESPAQESAEQAEGDPDEEEED